MCLQWKDPKGRTPLMYACNHAELYETAKILLELGAEKNAFRPRKVSLATSLLSPSESASMRLRVYAGSGANSKDNWKFEIRRWGIARKLRLISSQVFITLIRVV